MKISAFLILALFTINKYTHAQECESLNAEIFVVGYEELNPSISGEAPFVVNVDALSSCLGDETELTAWYQWNFGDPEGTNNEIQGWGAGHLYESPGEYTLTLSLTNPERETSSQSITVNVTESTRQDIFVSVLGDDANDGNSEENAIQSIARLNEIINHNQALKFSAGDTFYFSEGDRIYVDSLTNLTIDRYGEGANPVFMAPEQGETGQGGMVEIYNPSSQIIVQNVHFTSASSLSGLNPPVLSAVTTGSNGVTNVAVRNNSFHNISNGVNNGAEFLQARGVLIENNDADTLGLYLLYGSGSNHTVIGNTMNYSVDAHSVRFYSDRTFVYNNDLASHDQSTSVSAAGGQYAYISGNTLRHPARVSYFAVDGPSVYTHAVVENNFFIREEGLTDSFVPTLWILANSEHVVVRNNIFSERNSVSIRLGSDEVGEIDSIYIYNNTSLSETDNSGFLETFIPAIKENSEAVIANNLVVFPNFMGGKFNGDSNPFMTNISGGLTNYQFRNNVWEESLPGENDASGNPHRVNEASVSMEQWEAFDETENETYANLSLPALLENSFAPPFESIPDEYGIPVPGLYTDNIGNLRPLESPTAGAIELNIVSISNEGESEEITTFGLHQNYPNPFNPTTVISFQLSENSIVSLKVFDLLGREVATLINGHRSMGTHRINFDGSGLSSGVYFYVLKTPSFSQTRKMLLLK